MPHIFPCPAPRVKFADSDIEVLENGQRRRRRRAYEEDKGLNGRNEVSSTDIFEEISDEEAAALRRRAHECPVPKPKGVIGEALGFKRRQEEERPKIQVEKRKADGERGWR